MISTRTTAASRQAGYYFFVDGFTSGRYLDPPRRSRAPLYLSVACGLPVCANLLPTLTHIFVGVLITSLYKSYGVLSTAFDPLRRSLAVPIYRIPNRHPCRVRTSTRPAQARDKSLLPYNPNLLAILRSQPVCPALELRSTRLG